MTRTSGWAAGARWCWTASTYDESWKPCRKSVQGSIMLPHSCDGLTFCFRVVILGDEPSPARVLPAGAGAYSGRNGVSTLACSRWYCSVLSTTTWGGVMGSSLISGEASTSGWKVSWKFFAWESHSCLKILVQSSEIPQKQVRWAWKGQSLGRGASVNDAGSG